MDVRFLLATEPSLTHEDRIARSSEMRSASTPSADMTSSFDFAAAPLRSSITLSTGSSFSYTPLPDDYYSREAEYDYAAAHDYLNSLDSESETDEPDTPPLDYIGTGTPLFTPRLLAKILQAKAAGRPLQVCNPNVGRGKDETKRNSSNGRNKRSREDESDDELYRTKQVPDSKVSNAAIARKPRLKRPKGWKGWALVEVSSSEDEKAGKKLYDEEGRMIEQKVGEDSEIDSQAERVKSHLGWKGWALVQNPQDQSKLIKLDAPPLVLATRATRSGRTFGDGSG
ncbi:hypothetical protein M407DRAFT_29710 [Tulasnella calospora MUT 4182]|uniref:Uncharacterized protein n=1 Tax=Tulasnella calospora MUT 4182 TaxID=1051891 RepID=A0A0C3LGR2_9AGAM|nr:hypothetical protein M407DRAFT_29710 [Tulasnella calospora MUT 4182]